MRALDQQPDDEAVKHFNKGVQQAKDRLRAAQLPPDVLAEVEREIDAIASTFVLNLRRMVYPGGHVN